MYKILILENHCSIINPTMQNEVLKMLVALADSLTVHL